jgi:hypothetical protein
MSFALGIFQMTEEKYKNINYYRQCLVRISSNILFLTWIYLHEIEKTERKKENKIGGI